MVLTNNLLIKSHSILIKKMSKIFILSFLIFVLNIKVRQLRYVKIELNQLMGNCTYYLKFIQINDFVSHTEVNLQNFDSFENIKLECFVKYLTPIEKINFIPKNQLSLDNSLNISLNQNFFFEIIYFSFAYVKNFEICLDVFDILIENNLNFNLLFVFSKLEFKINPDYKKLDSFCSVFKKINSLKFLNSCKFSLSTNPFIFHNSNIDSLSINGLVDCFVKKNFLEFSQNQINIKSNIKSLELGFYRGTFTNKLLDRIVFKNIQSIVISGRLDYIDNDIFNYFEKLKEINLKNFFNLKIGLKFLSSLNSNLNLSSNLSDHLQNFTIKLNFIMNYFYPEEDFCYFKNFPQNKLILIESRSLVSICSCLIFWLFDSYYYGYGRKIIEQNNICWNLREADRCDYESMKAKCDRTSDFKNIYKTSQDYYFEAQQFYFYILILTPFFSLFGITSNILNIIVSRRLIKLNRNSKYSIFKLIKLNSFINLFYCFIVLFHLINICISINGIYCPEISRSLIMQYYEIFIVDFFGGILKTISNFLNFFISFERYNFLKNNATLLSKMEKRFRNILIILLILIFCLLINSEKPLTSVVNKFTFDNIYENTYPEYPIRNSFKGVLDPDLPIVTLRMQLKAKNPLYFGLFMFNFISNDLILFILLAVVDIGLLVSYKKILKQKQRITLNLFANSANKNFKEKTSSHRITTIVLIYSNILLFFRILELTMNSMVFKHSQYGERCTNINSICTIYYQIGLFFYLITSSFSTFLYFFMDKNFRIFLKTFLFD